MNRKKQNTEQNPEEKRESPAEETIRGLIRRAEEAQENAYAPYSHYLVGAALLCSDGSVVKGCNIENASYGAANCAERTAVFAAVAQGKREFAALALVAGPQTQKQKEPDGKEEKEAGSRKENSGRYPSPCGICRQVLREFVRPSDFPVIMAVSETDYRIRTLEELLPDSFGPEDLS